jgi:hypothetical protein
MKTGIWLVAGTPVDQPYPCRCHERLGKECSAAWCPCAGRPDPQGPRCCANWYGPEDHVAAMAAWRIEKMRREAAGE